MFWDIMNDTFMGKERKFLIQVYSSGLVNLLKFSFTQLSGIVFPVPLSLRQDYENEHSRQFTTKKDGRRFRISKSISNYNQIIESCKLNKNMHTKGEEKTKKKQIIK